MLASADMDTCCQAGKECAAPISEGLEAAHSSDRTGNGPHVRRQAEGRLLLVPLSQLPQVDRLVLATVNSVPEWHPEHDSFEPFPVHAWVIRHPDGAILVDTGVGLGNGLVDEWYNPQGVSLSAALSTAGTGTL